MPVVYSDPFASVPVSAQGPYYDAVVVTPSDTDDLVKASRAIYVGGAGDLKVNMLGGESGVVIQSVPAGTVLPIRATRVYSTGTAATKIISFY